MYVYVFICMYVCVYVCIYVYIYVLCVYVCMYIYVYMYVLCVYCVCEPLHRRRTAARWVPHDLSEEQKCRLLETAQQFLHRFREEGK